MDTKKRPIGVIILGICNLALFGINPLVTSFIPQNWGTFNEVLKAKHIDLTLSQPLIKIMTITQIIIACIFIASGIGLLLSKEWGRKIAVYFAFAVCLISLLVALMAPSLTGVAIIQIIYPAILIIYFTNKNVEAYFKRK